MGRKRFNTLWCCMVATGVFLTLASGCSRRTNHKVLTFFFTGVPPLEEEKKPVKEIDTSEVKKKLAEKVTLYSHAPWAEGKCNQCHKNAASFGVPGQKKVQKVFHKGGGMPGKLLLPKKELCIKCHEAMSKSKAYAEGLWLHPASAEGECNACHDPHQSKNPDMLLEKPEKICILCHLKGDALAPVDACKSEDCLSCHNPHMGKNRLLLTKDYKEVPQKVIVQESGMGDQGSVGRDQETASSQESLEPEGSSGIENRQSEIRSQRSRNKTIQ